MKRKDFFIIFLGAVIPWMIYLIINDIIELANFIVTTCAFGAAIYAIYNQHQESKQAEKNFITQFALQKEVALKQETIGAWQVLANKASGNSGKKEAIEFLASQGIPLCGIDMSAKTHGGSVYLGELFQDFKEEDRSKINLMGANFSGAILAGANFSYANLYAVIYSYGYHTNGTNFIDADLTNANFRGAHLEVADFRGADLEVADFSNAYLKVTDFSGTDLMSTDFSNVRLDKANFMNTNLMFTNFSNANLYKVDFSNASFISTNLDNANFYNCYINSNQISTYPDFPFEIDEKKDENNQPIYPENNPDYRYIKLKIK